MKSCFWMNFRSMGGTKHTYNYNTVVCVIARKKFSLIYPFGVEGHVTKVKGRPENAKL